jgi:tartrate-resistant acid phosphatase type 5
VRALRWLLIVDALALVAASTISDSIVEDVALGPTLLVGLILAIACLSADLVRPRRRVEWVCSALTIPAPFPFLILGGAWGPRAAAAAIIVLQVIPLVRARGPRPERPDAGGPRRLVGTLVVTTALLLITVVVLVWYGSAYLLQAPSTVFARGPFLTRVTTTSADFAWLLKSGDAPVSISVRSEDGTVTNAAGGHATGLRPGTRYVWTANLHGSPAAAGSFATAPTSTATPITLVSFGDYGSGTSHEYAVGRQAAAEHPALFLSSGDNAYLLAAPPFLDRAIFRPLHNLLAEAPAVVALGEHDLAYRDGAAVISALHLPGHQYSVQYGPVQVVVLGLQSDASAVAYANKTLGRCQGPCPVRFVLIHRPISASDPIMPVLRKHHVAAILAGHLHRYERHVRNGVLEFTVGTGGEGPGASAATRPTPDALVSFIAYGYLRIGIRGDRIDYQFVDENGRVRDRVGQTIQG